MRVALSGCSRVEWEIMFRQLPSLDRTTLKNQMRRRTQRPTDSDRRRHVSPGESVRTDLEDCERCARMAAKKPVDRAMLQP